MSDGTNGIAGVVGDMTGDLDVVVGELAELAVIHTELLLLRGGAEGETGDEVEEEEDEAGEGEGPGEGGEGAGELVAYLGPVALDPAEGGPLGDRKSTRLNSSHSGESRMPSSA